MKRYIRCSLTDKETGKPVEYYEYFNTSKASTKCDFLKSSGYELKKHKSFRHGWYSIYENATEIAVVMYDDGEANFNHPY